MGKSFQPKTRLRFHAKICQNFPFKIIVTDISVGRVFWEVFGKMVYLSEFLFSKNIETKVYKKQMLSYDF